MLKILSAIAVLATVSSTITWFPQAASAQTQGMERRDDRRGTRETSREVKQACKAGDENTRAECRQGKREVKQTGRHNETPPTDAARPATNSPP